MIEHPLTQYRLIVFDLDGTLRYCKAHGGPCHASPGEWALYDDVPPVLAQYDWQHVAWGVASNQAGVALGLIMLDEVLTEAYATITAAFARVGAVPCHGKLLVCPHAPADQCACRKPAPGLLLAHQQWAECSLGAMLFVGDSLEDAQAAARAGCAFFPAWEFFGRARPVWAQWTQPERDAAYQQVTAIGGRLA